MSYREDKRRAAQASGAAKPHGAYTRALEVSGSRAVAEKCAARFDTKHGHRGHARPKAHDGKTGTPPYPMTGSNASEATLARMQYAVRSAPNRRKARSIARGCAKRLGLI